VRYAMELPDRVPKERYFDPEFYALEAEHLWPRVWQMACRLEEIPNAGDFAEYTILDQSVIVVRTDDGVRAFQNACRHRGVRVVEGRGTVSTGFTCPFHGWCYGLDGGNTFVSRPGTFSEHNLQAGDIDLTPVRCETWGGCAWINLDDDALALRECLEPSATVLDAWHLASMRAEWWYACRLPVNWKLAQEAFMEQYHVLETHPQLRLPGRMPPRDPKAFDPQKFIEAELEYLRTMSEGMDGMVHANDVRIAEGMQDIELPADPALARSVWESALNDAVTKWHGDRGSDIPDLNELEASGMNEPMAYCFPHWFVLPMYSSASQYRFRPLGPEETLMEIWSLTRFPEGQEPPTPPQPEVWAHDDPRWPPIPAQDFSNLPRQQRGLHAKGFEYMRLSQQIEGHIGNFHRLIDGYLTGVPSEKLVTGLHAINVNPLDRAVVDLF
jgi:phenylpropionate dioxygenase-like ring-hydroxylating dioxygenase large terminal subunit